MNKLNLLFSCLALFSLASCVQPNGQVNSSRFPSTQQEDFDNMLAKNVERERRLGNDIQRKEFSDSIKHAMGIYMDSVRLFVNWKGKIEDIKSKSTGTKSTALEFSLVYEPEEFRKITFEVAYVVDNDSLENDKIYQTVKNLSNYSTVYFDGFIRTKANGDADYAWREESLMHSYPHLNFFIVDIYEAPAETPQSEKLCKALEIGYDVMQPLKRNFRKEISDKEMEKELKDLKPLFEAAKKELTEDEVSYVNRYTQALTLNFLYAQ